MPSSPSTTEDKARLRAESAAVKALFFLSLVAAALAAVDDADGFSSTVGNNLSESVDAFAACGSLPSCQ